MKKYKYKFLALLLLLLVVCLSFFFVTRDSKTPVFANELSTIYKNTRKYYGNRPGFWGLSTDSAINNNLIPSNMIKAGKIVNAYGKEIWLGKGFEATAVIPGSRGFDIILPNLSYRECVNILSFAFKDDLLLAITGIALESDNETYEFVWDEKNSFPMNTKKAKNVCSKNYNSIIFHFE